MRGGEVHTGVSDTLTIDQLMTRSGKRLFAGDEVTLDHDAHEVGVAGANLRGDVSQCYGLPTEVFLRIAVATVHHDPCAELRLLEHPSGDGNALGVVIGSVCPTAEHKVTIRIACRADNADLPFAIDPQKTMRMQGRTHGIDRRCDATVRAVLETDRHRQTRGHLPMSLTF